MMDARTAVALAEANMRILNAALAVQNAALKEQIRDQRCPAPNPLNKAA